MLLLVSFSTSSLAVPASVGDVRSIARLYYAAFNRLPAIDGLNFWVDSYERGRPLLEIAEELRQSPEFSARYGPLTDRQFVEQLYQNVLGRAGDSNGVEFWLTHLADGKSRARILLAFANAAETIDKTFNKLVDTRMSNCRWIFGEDHTAGTQYGCMTGPAVSGVSYQTPSHRGVTNSDGRFRYEPGETVRFTIGDTLLGKIVGKARVTPFDLADSAVATGLKITWAVADPDDPFQAVVNTTVLLQSLDIDAIPGNGIEVSAGVAALLQGVSLDLSQPWESFQDEPVLHSVLGKANRRGLFRKEHGIIRPAAAMKNLYNALAIDARVTGLSQARRETSDGNPATNEYVQYDTDGNVIRHEVEGLGVETWHYDSSGNVTRHEQDAIAGYDAYDAIRTWQYDVNGDVIRYQLDSGANNSPDQVTRYEYNADGNPTRIATDHKVGGQPDDIATWQYHADGKVMLFKEEWLESGKLMGFESTQYDVDGNVTRYEHHDNSGDPASRHIETWHYNQHGNVIRHELDDGFRGLEIETWQYWYDNGDKVIRAERMDELANSLLQVETWQYDDNNRVTQYECKGSCDGGPWLPSPTEHRLESRQYHDNGNVMQHEIAVSGEFEDLGQRHDIAAFYRYYYDVKGNLTREEQDGFWIEEKPDGEPDFIETFNYDDDNRLRRREEFEGAERMAIETWSYDTDGNLRRHELDENGDDEPDLVESWQYDTEGNLKRDELDEDGDGNFDETITYRYEATAWGHLFSGIALYGHDSPPPEDPRPDPNDFR